MRMVTDLNAGKKYVYMAGAVIAAILSVAVLTGCEKKYVKSSAVDAINRDFSAVDERQLSLENRDYVIKLIIDELNNDGSIYRFNFEMADLTEYKGDSGNLLATLDYACEADSLEAAMDKYFAENERQLDLGHLSEIVINDSQAEVKSNQLIFEMSRLPGIAKSVPTRIIAGRQNEELILREVIKNVYAGEDF